MNVLWIILLGTVVRGQSPLEEENDEAIERFVDDIENENYANATKRYFSLPTFRTKSKAIRNAYKTENVGKILRFSEELPTLLLRTEAISSLIEKINDAKDQPADALRVQTYLENKYGKIRLDEYSYKAFDNIHSMIKSIEPKVIARWVSEIKEGSYKEIQAFAGGNDPIFSKYLERIVNDTFKSDDLTTAEILLKYSNALPNIEQSSRTIICLYNYLKGKSYSKDLAMYLASEINILQRMGNYKNIANDQQEKLEAIMNDLPESIRGIVRGDELCIRNTKTFGLLFVQGHYDIDRDVVSAHPNPNGDNLSRKWRFEKDDDNTYRIKTSPNDDYLYAATNGFAYSDQERRLFTWRPSTGVSQGKWDLQDSDWRNNEYLIYNVLHKEYLNAEDPASITSVVAIRVFQAILKNKNPNHETSRSAFTWRGGGKGNKPQWKIQFC